MPRQPDFKKLKKTWYYKLADEGFVDIERDEFNLKNPSAKFFQRKHGLATSGRWKASLEYYYMAEHFLNNYKFYKQLDEVIWEYHIAPMSVRDIASTLNKLGIYKTNRTCVWQSIKKTRQLMYRAAALARADETNEQ